MTEDFVGDALHRAAELLPDAPDRLSAVRRKRASIVRLRLTGAAAALALVGSGTAYALMSQGSAAKHDALLVEPSPAVGDLTATGRVVKVPGKAPRFCAPVGSDAMLRVPEPPPAWCELGVDVQGVDLAALEDRREQEGAVEGNATLTGRLVDDVLVVSKQEKPVVQAPDPFNVNPPGCTAPPEGWPSAGPGGNPDVSAAQAFQTAHPDLVAEIAIARPSATQAYPFLLSWGDPAPVRDALKGDYGDRFCVLQSRWTRSDYAAAAAEVGEGSTLYKTDGVYVSSPRQMGNDGQLTVTMEAVRSTPNLEAVVARHPAGLIKVTYWLHPVS